MAVVQFQRYYQGVMRRYHRPQHPNTQRVLTKYDEYAKRIQVKGMNESARESLERKLSDQLKIIHRTLIQEGKDLKKSHPELLAEIADKSKQAVADRTLRSILEELRKLARATTRATTELLGKEADPAALPESKFVSKYQQIMQRSKEKGIPAVEQAMKKLDDAKEAKEVTPLYKSAKKALDEQLAKIGNQINGSKADPDTKKRLNTLAGELEKLRGELKDYDKRVFLFDRLNR